MVKGKYIAFEHQDTSGPADFVLFSILQKHSDVARKLPGKVISAGFFEVVVDESGESSIRCHGRSDSLEVDSRTEDSAEATFLFRL